MNLDRQESVVEPRRPRIAGVVARLTLVNTLTLLAGVVTGPLLARGLGPAGRGTLAAILVPLTLAPWVVSLGLSSYASREAARGRPVEIVLGSLGAVSLALGALGAAAAFPVAQLLAGDRHVVYVYLVVGLLLLPLALVGNLLLAIATGLERWGLVMSARLVPPLLALLGIVALFAVDRLTVSTAAAVTLVAMAASIVPLLRILLESGFPRLDVGFMVRGVRFGVTSWVGDLGGLANYQLDQLLMILLVTPRQLGLYAVAVTISGAWNVVSGALGSVLFPRVAQGESTLPARAVRVMVWVVAVGGAALAVTVYWLLPLLFGVDFRAAVVMTWILLLASIPNQAASVLGMVVTAAGRPGLSTSSELLALTITVPGLFLLLPALAGVGAALVSLAAYLARFLFLLVSARRLFGGTFHDYIFPTMVDFAWINNSRA